MIDTNSPEYIQFQNTNRNKSGVPLKNVYEAGIDIEGTPRITKPGVYTGTLLLKVWATSRKGTMLWCYITADDGKIYTFSLFRSHRQNAPVKTAVRAPLGSLVECVFSLTQRSKKIRCDSITILSTVDIPDETVIKEDKDVIYHDGKRLVKGMLGQYYSPEEVEETAKKAHEAYITLLKNMAAGKYVSPDENPSLLTILREDTQERINAIFRSVEQTNKERKKLLEKGIQPELSAHELGLIERCKIIKERHTPPSA